MGSSSATGSKAQLVVLGQAGLLGWLKWVQVRAGDYPGSVFSVLSFVRLVTRAYWNDPSYRSVLGLPMDSLAFGLSKSAGRLAYASWL